MPDKPSEERASVLEDEAWVDAAAELVPMPDQWDGVDADGEPTL